MLHQVCFNSPFWLRSSLCLLFPAVLNSASLALLHLIYYNDKLLSTNYFSSIKYPRSPDTNNTLFLKLNYHLSWAYLISECAYDSFIHKTHDYVRNYEKICQYMCVYLLTRELSVNNVLILISVPCHLIPLLILATGSSSFSDVLGKLLHVYFSRWPLESLS